MENDKNRPKLDEDGIPIGWLSRKQCTDVMGCTTITLVNYEKRRWLHPKRVNRHVYYDPAEVKELMDKLGMVPLPTEHEEERAEAERRRNGASVSPKKNGMDPSSSKENGSSRSAPMKEEVEEEEAEDFDPDEIEEGEEEEEDDGEEEGGDDGEEEGEIIEEEEEPSPRRLVGRGGASGLLRRRGGYDPRDPRAREDELEGWLTTGQVAARLRIHPSSVKARIKRGDLQPVKRDGRDWFDPEEIDALAPQSVHEMATAELLTSANGIIKAMQGHLENVLGVSVKTGFQMMELMADTLKNQNQRIKDLEAEVSQGKLLVDKAETLEHERLLKQAEFNQAAEMKQRLMHMIETNAPAVVAMIGSKFAPGSPVAIDAQSRAVLSIVESLTPEQMSSIAPVLSKEQAMAIAGVRHAIERSKEASSSPDPTHAIESKSGG
jgi:hypothetical protein